MLARELMNAHGLYKWKFRFDRARKRFGCCYWSLQLITLSAPLVRLNSEAQVRDTILHEIAHALCDKGDGHNERWRRTALAIGCSGERCFDEAVTRPPAKYRTECPRCHKVGSRLKVGVVACRDCCNRYNNGRYSESYRLVFTHTQIE